MVSGEKIDQDVKWRGIFIYEVLWVVYGMNWSVWKNSKFCFVVGSFIEDYRNKVEIV